VWEVLPDDRARAVAEQATAAVRIAGLPVQTHMVDDEPADALIEVAREVGATLLVVGSQGMKGPRRLLGSVPNKLSHHTPCDLLIVATDRSGRG
jgi:nucleotide-binding universal stress UspA family protein